MPEVAYEIELWTGASLDEPAVLAAGTIGELRAALADWARAPSSPRVSPDPPDVGSRRRVWSYMDEAAAAAANARRASMAADLAPGDDIMDYSEPEPDITPGWYDSRHPSGITQICDADALARHLILSGAVTTTTAYANPLAAGDGLQAHLVRTIHTVEPDDANEYLARGWRIIATNYRGGLDEAGILVGRTAMLVLGHPEPNAI